MTQVIEFPTNSVRNLVKLDASIRVFLREQTSDTKLIEYVSLRVMAYAEEYLNKTFTFTLPSNITAEQLDAFQKSFSDELQDMASNIIMERILLEIELYKHR